MNAGRKTGYGHEFRAWRCPAAVLDRVLVLVAHRLTGRCQPLPEAASKASISGPDPRGARPRCFPAGLPAGASESNSEALVVPLMADRFMARMSSDSGAVF
eukprot:9013760-Pyramimonas_sp.AAC.1